jgi:hypothetical protein
MKNHNDKNKTIEQKLLQLQQQYPTVTMVKGTCSSTIKCKDKDHYNRLLARFKRRGYKQVPYVEEVKLETYPF